ncbi:uncharacterized protein LOC110098045 isoform X1 [Dendrobium catenatum]|uniref:uncharacterized protein LOC110098045 isoform X1 n=1 Tax=Dendrobium catenatum TaxID=906689 RepID=UPI0009F4320F|nr:uncharacterized protein LOC110098045 isoform X1 [Dendrobium catenatum]XP_020680422.1 uncharacterized protein LOC110098045 isoform X1 [Dendrobium catenatum]
MAANSRFDYSLSSPDGPTYSNGQRGSYSAATLEKLGSFREGSDRILSSPPGTSKANAAAFQGDMICLLQSLASDLKVITTDHRLNRSGEMKRAVTNIFGTYANDTSSVAFGTKPLTSSCLEEIKRLKNNLQDHVTKARDRVKIFGDASSKIDKFCHIILKKRSRVDSFSGERSTGLNQGSISKIGPQSHLSGCVLEVGSQRLEDKAKISVPNRRIRTSLVEANGTSRTSGPLERDKDILKSTNGSAAQGDESDRGFSTVVDGWERSRMKKKRSVIKSDVSASSGLVKSQFDRETKRVMQQKLGSDVRPKLNYSHSFRSASNTNTTLAGKIDSSAQQNATSVRSRNEQNHVSVPNDRRDARFCPDTESPSLRVISKLNSREDTCVASTTLPKFGSARGPRSNSGSLSKTSPNIHRVVGNPEDMEPPQTLGVVNRKRSASIRSSSPPVGQWAVQRPQKMSRSSRRSSLSPLISSHDELSISETAEDALINHDDLAGTRRESSNASQHNKMRGDNFAPASLSESEESGVQENKLKDKVKKRMDIKGKPVQAVQKFTNLIMPSRKNGMAVEEDCGDVDRRQGRIRRGFAPVRSGMPAAIEKLSDVVTTKQQRSARHGSERVESKPGRPPIKKLSERKSYARPRQLISSSSMEFSDEVADDHEELVAAATAALDTGRICFGSFWNQVEPVFSFVSTEDTTFLREQIDKEHVVMPSAAVVANRCESNAFSNGVNFYGCERETVFTKQTTKSDHLLEQFMPQCVSYSGISICQALISAIIEEDDMDNLYNTGDCAEAYSCNDLYAARFELDKDLETKGLNLHLLEDCQTTGRNLDYYKVDPNRRFHDEISRESLGTNGIPETVNRPLSSPHQALNQLAPNQTTPFSTYCSEFLYNQMSFNDRLILELSEIGLYPEPVPDLTYGEGEDITKGIHILEEKLHEQASNRKNLLRKLEKGVMDANELQQRNLERLAMDCLVLMAYDRYMSCWGPSASGSKNVNKFAKHAALAFIKRTLTRCKKFEETGISCFHEPVFRDIFLSASSHSGHLNVTDLPADASQIARGVDAHAKSSNAAPSINPPIEHPFSNEETWSNHIKKKEVLLDDVVGNTSGPSSRTSPGLGSSLASGAKGKRSERDRDGKGYNRDSAFKNSTAKIGRPSTSISKGERKNKTKPKVKTTQLSASVNVLHSKTPDISGRAGSGTSRDVKQKEDLNLKSANENDPIDLSHLQIPDMDVVDFGGQGQDIASWLNFEEEGTHDQEDFMGLEIPMDDLSEVHIMI